MAKHRRIRREDLKSEIVSEIGMTHSMTLCPLCGGEFAKERCLTRYKDSGHGVEGSKVQTETCNACDIVWELAFHNWQDDDNGMIRNMKHTVVITAFADCFCRAFLFDNNPRTILIHQEKGHARMGARCTSKETATVAPV